LKRGWRRLFRPIHLSHIARRTCSKSGFGCECIVLLFCCRVCCGARECDELVVCSHCPTAFCKTCLARSLGDEGLHAILGTGITWRTARDVDFLELVIPSLSPDALSLSSFSDFFSSCGHRALVLSVDELAFSVVARRQTLHHGQGRCAAMYGC
jgi:hypothetical protein